MMLLQNTKFIFFNVFKSNITRKHLTPLVLQVSCSTQVNQGKINRAMKVYMQKAREYDNFMKEQLDEFSFGKKHLANIMGQNYKTMTQEDIDKAIEYLLPSALFVPRARPRMKPPNEVFGEKKTVQFDENGRPFHTLFYTGAPNFNQVLHNAAVLLEKLNDHQAKILREKPYEPPQNPVKFINSDWLTKEELEEKLLERLYSIDYEKYINVFTCLAEHPYNSMVEDFIRTYRKDRSLKLEFEPPAPVILEDGSKLITINDCKRLRARADVTVKYPGTGIIKINGQDLDYFTKIQSREQVSELS